MSTFNIAPGIYVQERDFTGVVRAVSASIGAFAGVFSKGPLEEAVTISSKEELVDIFGEPTLTNNMHFVMAEQFLEESRNLKIVRATTDNITNATSNGAGLLVKNADDYDENYSLGTASTGSFIAKTPGSWGNSIKVSMFTAVGTDETAYQAWEYSSLFDSKPSTSSYVGDMGGSNDELHVVIVDADGKISGTPGTVLKTYSHLSQASDAKNLDNQNNYWKEVINNDSKWVWVGENPSELTNIGSLAINQTFVSSTSEISETLFGGVDNDSFTIDDMYVAYDVFADREKLDISIVIGPYLPAGANGISLANYVINIADGRKDCVATISPPVGDIIGQSNKAQKLLDFANAMPSSSYYTMDSGVVQRRDIYNKRNIWVPNSAGNASRMSHTDNVAESWYPHAGINRGTLDNVTKIAFNPNETQREALWKARMNSIVQEDGFGIYIHGERTGLNRSSVFEATNVRRLLITLEKSIAKYSKQFMYELNDELTASLFKQGIEPFLRRVQANRGIEAFNVETERNTSLNQLISRIQIVPVGPIRQIILDFQAHRDSTTFTETIIG